MIGETIHSGPTLAARTALKDEDLNTADKCLFPGNLQDSTQTQIPPCHHSNHQAQIPSTTPSSPPQLLETPVPTSQSLPQLSATVPPPVPRRTTHHHLDTKGSLSSVYIPDHVVPKIKLSKVSKKKKKSCLRRGVLEGSSKGEVCDQDTQSEGYESHIVVPRDTASSEVRIPKVTRESVVLKNELGGYVSQTREIVKTIDENVEREIKKEPEETEEPLHECEHLNTNEINIKVKDEKLAFEESQTTELTSGIGEIPDRKPYLYEPIPFEYTTASAVTTGGSTNAVLDPLDLTVEFPVASFPEENKAMVRLIQEVDAKVDSFCHKRATRLPKKIANPDFALIDLKPGAVSRVRRCTRTRKCSCRSDKSESETSDSRSVADELPYFDMVDKTSKPGKPKNGESLLDEAAAHVSVSVKLNGEVSSDIANGTHKIKGRRVSRTNSDESDSNSGLKTNGNIDQNGDKVDFSVLLEISPADRKKFESKKAKIRRKTADWLLISETERYYNEKEEIMRNKNKLESDSESDESDDASTEEHQQDSRSDCSDESESAASASQRNKSKTKPIRTTNEDDSRPSENDVQKPKDDQPTQRKRGRPAGSRNRKTLYDLTMLNDDDDDDNFFGFPVSTTIPSSTRTSIIQSGAVSHTRSKAKESGCKHSYDEPSSSGSGKAGRKRLSDAERFLRDNREYYNFQETPERLRRSTSSSAEKEKLGRLECCEAIPIEKKEEQRVRDPPSPPVCRRQLALDGRRVTRSTGVVLEELDLVSKPKVKCSEKDDTKGSLKNVDKDLRDRDKRKQLLEDSKKKCSDDRVKDLEVGNVKEVESERICSDEDKCVSENKKDSVGHKTCSGTAKWTVECVTEASKAEERRQKPSEAAASNVRDDGNGDCTVGNERSDGPLLREHVGSELQQLYFSFEGVPDQESWYQTYQRLLEGVTNNEFSYEEDPLRFVLPYEMPKEYVKDFMCYKKGLLAKKKGDLADLVRKSPRCHASTLALFSDIIPTKRIRNAKVLRSTPAKTEDISSDGTSTPGAESTKLPPQECFETPEELAILAMHIDHIMKSENCCEEAPLCTPPVDDLKEAEPDCKKAPLKKRGKKKRLVAASKTEKGFEAAAKEFKLFDSSLAQEVDPVFIAGLCDDMKDFLIPENILAREASEVVEDSCFCVCTDRASCDDFSSADDNTEASSECVSLCDSETIDCSVVSEPKRGRSAKKRRKNLTGWPKAQKRKKPAPSQLLDDNDSAMGWDDLEPKKHRGWKKHNFSLLQQTTTERLAALAACDRRASPRKKASVLYMDTWPVRF